MSSSVNDDLTSVYAGSDGICSYDYACNSEDVPSANPEGGDDPDSAELSNGFDHVSCASGSDDSVSQAESCQGETPIETSSKKRRLRMMDEDSDGVRIKIIPCVEQQFRRRMEATKVLNDDFYVPNRAQLMLSFSQKHGGRIVLVPRNASRVHFSSFSMPCKNSAGHRQ